MLRIELSFLARSSKSCEEINDGLYSERLRCKQEFGIIAGRE